MEENIIKEVKGVFDGKCMESEDGRLHPVPPNYASVAKLVEGDELLLKIDTEKGTYFKQTLRVPRGVFPGMAVEEEGRVKVEYDGRTYDILPATLTYYNIKPGQEVFIVLPKGRIPEWAAVEAVI